jgi:UDP-glucose 4-epimerase
VAVLDTGGAPFIFSSTAAVYGAPRDALDLFGTDYPISDGTGVPAYI